MRLTSLLRYFGISTEKYCILSSTVHTFYIENDVEIFPAHYTWQAAKKGFEMAVMMK